MLKNPEFSLKFDVFKYDFVCVYIKWFGGCMVTACHLDSTRMQFEETRILPQAGYDYSL